MEEENKNNEVEQQPSEEQGGNSSRNIIVLLAVALVVALLAVIVMGVVLLTGDSGDSESGEVATLPPAAVTEQPTVEPPTPEPSDPTAIVTAPKGVNVRTGPGTVYPVIGIAPMGTELEIVGVSEDGTWWAVHLPGAPNNMGWIAGEYVIVENADNVPVITAPPTPTPQATATATPTPSPEIEFTASRTTINAGETATLAWRVENVKAVFLYPVGDRFENYPVTGQGTKDVQPFITTSYELLVFNMDDSVSAERIEITVIGGLTSYRWILQSYSSPSTGQRTPLPGTQITARFATDGTLSGSAGCNSYNGSFTAFDQTLRIGTLSSSQALCGSPEGIMEQEGLFLSLMHQASRMAISAGQLTIYDSAGNMILTFLIG
jgi:heat shock protein HslJ/uncharacterized protein YraI